MQKIRPRYAYAIAVIAYTACRLVFLDRGIHVDEPHWLGRSFNFSWALLSGEFKHTYQQAHPGVMTMWAGAIAYMFRMPHVISSVPSPIDVPYGIANDLWSWGQDPLHMLVAARSAKIILQSGFFAISLAVLHRIIGQAATILFAFLVAFSPTLLGWDSWLHIDGMSSITIFASMTAISLASERTDLDTDINKPTVLLWILAAVLSAAAWLTRITSLLLVCVVALALLMQIVVQSDDVRSSFRRIPKAIAYACIWLSSSLVATFALFPALWVAPLQTINTIIILPISGVRGTGPESFFPKDLRDPGWTFYPIDILLRTTPLDWVGVIALLVFSYAGWKRGVISGPTSRLVLLVLAFAAIFLLGNSLSPKKYIRYILPVYPAVILAGSVGLVLLGNMAGQVFKGLARKSIYAIASVAIIYSLTRAISSYPDKIVYTNPVTMYALDRNPTMTLPHGQEEVASYLRAAAQQHPIVVSPGSIRYALAYYISPDLPITYNRAALDSPAGWYAADLFIMDPGSPYRDLLAPYDPVMSVHRRGRVTYEIYPTRSLPLPASLKSPTACTWTFGDRMTLLQVVRGERHTDLYFLAIQEGPITIDVEVETPDAQQSLEPIETTLSPHGTVTRVRFAHPENLDVDPEEVTSYRIRAYADLGLVLSTSAIGSRVQRNDAEVTSDCYSRPAPYSQETSNAIPYRIRCDPCVTGPRTSA